MDFVFDRMAEERSIKNLTVVDDGTHEAVATVAERAMGGNQLVRVLDALAITRGLERLARAGVMPHRRRVSTAVFETTLERAPASRS